MRLPLHANKQTTISRICLSTRDPPRNKAGSSPRCRNGKLESLLQLYFLAIGRDILMFIAQVSWTSNRDVSRSCPSSCSTCRTQSPSDFLSLGIPYSKCSTSHLLGHLLCLDLITFLISSLSRRDSPVGTFLQSSLGFPVSNKHGPGAFVSSLPQPHQSGFFFSMAVTFDTRVHDIL